MDAAYTSLKKTAFFLALATLIPAAAFAQPAFVLNSGSNTTSIILIANQSTPVTVASTAANITYTAHAQYQGGDLAWLCINNPLNSPCDTVNGLVTPNTLSVLVGQNAADLSIGTHFATITLTATDGSGAIAGTINVQYTTNSFQGGGGGGGGSLTVSPTTPSISAGYGGQTTLSFQVSTSGTTSVAFSLPLVQPSVSWATNFFQTSGTSGAVSPGIPATFEVSLNGAGQQETTLQTTLTISFTTGALNIPISFGNGVNVGGTSGSGTLSLSTNPVPLSYTSGTNTFPSASVLLSSTSGAVTYSFNTSSTNNWLLINGQTQGSNLPLPATLSITADSNVATLSPGASSGAVNITGSDGSSILLTVTVTVSGTNTSGLTISPNPIALNAALNGQFVQQIVTITSVQGGAVSVGISGQGLSVSAPANSSIAANSSTNVTVTGTPTGLTAQTIVGQLTVNVGGIQQSDQINFQVGSTSGGGGTSTTISAAPTAMSFAYEMNSGMQINQSQQAYIAGSGSYTAAATVNNSGLNWLSVSSSSGTLPQQFFEVTANATGLAAGTYTGTVTFINTGNGQSSTIGVTLLVTGTTAIYTIPGDLVFSYIAGTTSANQSQALSISSSDSSPVTVSAAIANPGNTPWLTVNSNSINVTGSAESTVTVNANNLANGLYTGSITVTGSVGNSPLNVPVVLSVSGSSVTSGSGTLTLGSSALTLSPQVNGPAVSTTLGVSASTNTSYTVSSLGSFNGVTWLSVSPSGTLTTSGNPNLTVTATPFNFPAGTYSGTITLAANTGVQTVQVTMVIGGSVGASSNITVTANGGTSTSPTLSFSSSTPGATVTPQYLTVSSALGSSGVGFQATTSTTNGVNWILVSTSGAGYTTSTTGTTPATLNVTVNTTALTAGTYNGSVIVTPTGGTAVTVPVTLTLGAATVAVSQTTLAFNYQAGGATPNTQSVNVTVSNTNASGATFTATATSTPAGWLVVTPTSGAAPGTLIVSIVPTGLSAGTYTGSIAVAGASGATGSSTINVTLTVTVPLPTITAVVNAASFVNEPISPGEIITIGGTSIGPATPASFTVTTSFGSQFVPTSGLAGVQVLVNGFPAPVLYVSAGQINAIVPYEIAGFLNPTVLVKFLGQSSNGFVVTAGATAAGIFTTNGSGSGPGAILNSDSSVNSASNAAARGSEIVIYMTGEGQTSPAGVDGKVTTAPYPAPLLPIAVTIGGAPATVAFMGEAPGLVSGVLQLNVIVPSTLTTTGAVPVSVTFGTTSTSQGGVTVNIR